MLEGIMVRRLPVLQNQDTDDAAAARRPRWQWVLIGAGFVVTLFLPLSLLGVWFGGMLSRTLRTGSHGPEIVLAALPVALCFVLAGGGAGALVGRFGGRAKAREATASGALGAFAVWGLAALGGPRTPWMIAVLSLFTLVVLGAGAAFVGARIALARRV